MLNSYYFLNKNYNKAIFQPQFIIKNTIVRFGADFFALSVVAALSLAFVTRAHASQLLAGEYKNIQYKNFQNNSLKTHRLQINRFQHNTHQRKKYERDVVYSNYRNTPSYNKFGYKDNKNHQSDHKNRSRFISNQYYSNHNKKYGHKRNSYRSYAPLPRQSVMINHNSTVIKQNSIRQPSVDRSSHYYADRNKNRIIKSDYPSHLNTKRHSHFITHDSNPRKKHYDERYYSYSDHHQHKKEVAYLLGGIILGKLLAEKSHYSITHYSDGYTTQPYARVKKRGCYEVAYEYGQRILVEVPPKYCRAYR